ncbi:unnamed protein product [Eruca vesicaria subsp. sativa]|uniref:Aminotransferase class I/classII domain-containing protein n=1 Tax=Eruca vesicaria subsp. sativa TaxID=29727 RepID=A0ABC8K7T8_ERUVS|nr:unnamed protein product [Eruca vesicaria subsp. sativa]
MANKRVGWKFSGSQAAKEASSLCAILTESPFCLLEVKPPRLASCHTTEKAVVNAVLCGTGNAYAPDDVFMTVGCKQAIELAVDILAKPKANVLLPSPGWPWDVVRAIYKKLEVR